MKSIQAWLIGLLALVMVVGCQGGTGSGTAGSSGSSDASGGTSDTTQAIPSKTMFSSFSNGSDTGVNSYNAVAQVLVESSTTSFTKTYQVPLEVNDSTLEVLTTIPINLSPGEYTFYVATTVTANDGTGKVLGSYAANTGLVYITKNAGSINVIMHPVLGSPLSTVSMVKNLVPRDLKYPGEILNYANPRLSILASYTDVSGATVNSRYLFSVNKSQLKLPMLLDNTPRVYFNMPVGQKISVDPSIYDGYVKIATTDQSTSVDVVNTGSSTATSGGTSTGTIDVSYLLTSSLTVSATTDSTGTPATNFVFTIPDDAVKAVGGVNNLEATATIVGQKNPEVSWKFTGSLIVPPVTGTLWSIRLMYPSFVMPDDVTWSLTLADKTNGTVIGYCGATITVSSSDVSVTCTLHQIDPTITTANPVVATTFTVVDGLGTKLPGAVVSMDGKIVSVTGDGTQGTSLGQSVVFSAIGDHTAQASFPLTADLSGIVTFTVKAADTSANVQLKIPVILAQPPVTSFSALAGPAAGQVSLTWTNPSTTTWPYFAGVRVVRSATNYPTYDAGVFGPADSVVVMDTATAPATNSLVDATFPVVDGVTGYYYRAFAYDSYNDVQTAGTSDKGYAVPPRFVCLNPPAKVSSFTATVGTLKVYLNWANPYDVDWGGVLIVRKRGGYPQSPTDGKLIVNTGQAGHPEWQSYTDTSFVDNEDNLLDTDNEIDYQDPVTGAEYPDSFYYAVYSTCTTGKINLDAALAVATPLKPADKTPPGPVTDFNAKAGELSVTVSWANPNPMPRDYAGVLVVRKENTIPEGDLDGVLVLDSRTASNPKLMSYTDRTVSAGVTYCYRAYTIDLSGNIQYNGSKTADCATPVAPPTVELPPPTPASPLVLSASRTSKQEHGYSDAFGPNWSGTYTIPSATDVRLVSGTADNYVLSIKIGDVKCHYMGGKWTGTAKGEHTTALERTVANPTCTGGDDDGSRHKGPYKPGDTIYTSRPVRAHVITGDPQVDVTTVQITVPVIWNHANPAKQSGEGRSWDD